MKTRKTALITAVIVGLGIVLFGWFGSVNAERVSTSKQYEVIVPEAKSDTQRIIEAYERLSDQYLSMVQNQFTLIATNNQEMASRLERMEKKIDELSAKIDALQKQAAPPAPRTGVRIDPRTGDPIAPPPPLPEVSGSAGNVPAVVK